MPKKITTRIQNKHDIEANWKLAENFIPYAGEIIVYDPDDYHSFTRVKVGDGVTNINNLPFASGEFIAKTASLQCKNVGNIIDYRFLNNYRGDMCLSLKDAYAPNMPIEIRTSTHYDRVPVDSKVYCFSKNLIEKVTLPSEFTIPDKCEVSLTDEGALYIYSCAAYSNPATIQVSLHIDKLAEDFDPTRELVFLLVARNPGVSGDSSVASKFTWGSWWEDAHNIQNNLLYLEDASLNTITTPVTEFPSGWEVSTKNIWVMGENLTLNDEVVVYPILTYADEIQELLIDETNSVSGALTKSPYTTVVGSGEIYGITAKYYAKYETPLKVPQSDFLENDPKADSYIKNRPFGDFGNTLVETHRFSIGANLWDNWTYATVGGQANMAIYLTCRKNTISDPALHQVLVENLKVGDTVTIRYYNDFKMITDSFTGVVGEISLENGVYYHYIGVCALSGYCYTGTQDPKVAIELIGMSWPVVDLLETGADLSEISFYQNISSSENFAEIAASMVIGAAAVANPITTIPSKYLDLSQLKPSVSASDGVITLEPGKLFYAVPAYAAETKIEIFSPYNITDDGFPLGWCGFVSLWLPPTPTTATTATVSLGLGIEQTSINGFTMQDVLDARKSTSSTNYAFIIFFKPRLYGSLQWYWLDALPSAEGNTF